MAQAHLAIGRTNATGTIFMAEDVTFTLLSTPAADITAGGHGGRIVQVTPIDNVRVGFVESDVALDDTNSFRLLAADGPRQFVVRDDRTRVKIAALV